MKEARDIIHIPTMSGAGEGSANTTKAVTQDTNDTSKPLQPQKPAAQLEEDDEFEDFPVEGELQCSEYTLISTDISIDWQKEEEVGAQATTTHLWEESWDDDDTSDDFSAQLKAELEKTGQKKS